MKNNALSILFALFTLFGISPFAFSAQEKEIYILFLKIEDGKNQQNIENFFAQVVSAVGFELLTTGLEIKNTGKQNSRFSKWRMLNHSDYSNQPPKEYNGVIRGDCYKTGISGNSHFFITEQKNIFAIETKHNTEEFLNDVGNELKHYLNEIKKSLVCNEIKPLIFLYFL